MTDVIYHEAIGQGPPILTMHGGLGLDHQYLRPALDGWAEFSQVVFYDHRGNGRSEPPASWAEVSMDSMADDAARLQSALGLDPAIVFGHSYGGFIALHYALRHRSRLKGLILASTAANLSHPPRIPDDADADAVAAFGELFSGPMESDEKWAETWRRVLPLYRPGSDPDAVSDIHARTRYRCAAWNHSASLLAGYDVLAQLGSIDAPVLLLGGRHDFITGPPGLQDMHSMLPDSTLVFFEDSGHFPFLTEPDRFGAVVEEWVRGL